MNLEKEKVSRDSQHDMGPDSLAADVSVSGCNHLLAGLLPLLFQTLNAAIEALVKWQVKIARIQVRTIAAGENKTTKEGSFRLGAVRQRFIDSICFDNAA